MKLHRFIGPYQLSESDIVINDKALVNQIKNVLKLKVGEHILLCDGNRNEAEAEIYFLKNTIELRILSRYANANEPNNRIELLCAVLKRENFEFVVQKATEVGVASITPLVTQRTIKTGINVERLKKIAHEAAEQSGRGIVPEINAPLAFKDVFKKVDLTLENYFFDFGDMPIDAASNGTEKSVRLFIGPEGGWTDEERKMAKTALWQFVSLGPLTLRAETAAIVASYLFSRSGQ